MERLAVTTPTVILTFSSAPGGTETPQSQVGEAYVRRVDFVSGMTDNVGEYSCSTAVFFNPLLGGIASAILQMQSMLVYIILGYYF